MMTLAQHLFSDSFIYATGMMILHTMWQAIILASLLTILLIIFRRSSPQTRYNAALITLLVLPVIAFITFFSELNNYSAELLHTTHDTTNRSESIGLNTFFTLYSKYLPLIVTCWVFGITILLLKSLGQLVLVQRLKNHYLEPISDHLNELLKIIKAELNISQHFKAYLSTKALTPMVIGHRNPVILFPKNKIESLQENEIIAVIRHELAHIKRNDYAINLIQSFIEIIFFFHPVTWWISAIVRKEREECCDTYAFENEQSKVALAHALTKLETTEENSYAVALINSKQSLTKRIKAMFKNRPLKPSFKEGAIVASFVIVSITLMSFITKNSSTNEPKTAEIAETISGQSANGDYIFAKTNAHEDIVELYVNGKKVKSKRHANYLSIIDSLKKSSSYQTETTASVKTSETEIIEKDDSISDMISNIIQSVSSESDEDVSLNIDINESDETVKMNIDENSFFMDIDNEEEKVKMTFDESGFSLQVIEGGKETVNMNINIPIEE